MARTDRTGPEKEQDRGSAWLESYAAGPDELEAALDGLGEPDLDVARAPGKWTIRQTIHHIVDGDDIWKVCIKAALGNPGTVFSLGWYRDKPQNEWAESWAYSRREVEPSLAQFRASRRHVVQLVKQVPDAAECWVLVRWSGGEEQRMSVGEIIEMQARHVSHHVQQIRQAREVARF